MRQYMQWRNVNVRGQVSVCATLSPPFVVIEGLTYHPPFVCKLLLLLTWTTHRKSIPWKIFPECSTTWSSTHLPAHRSLWNGWTIQNKIQKKTRLIAWKIHTKRQFQPMQSTWNGENTHRTKVAVSPFVPFVQWKSHVRKRLAAAANEWVWREGERLVHRQQSSGLWRFNTRYCAPPESFTRTKPDGDGQPVRASRFRGTFFTFSPLILDAAGWHKLWHSARSLVARPISLPSEWLLVQNVMWKPNLPSHNQPPDSLTGIHTLRTQSMWNNSTIHPPSLKPPSLDDDGSDRLAENKAIFLSRIAIYVYGLIITWESRTDREKYRKRDLLN